MSATSPLTFPFPVTACCKCVLCHSNWNVELSTIVTTENVVALRFVGFFCFRFDLVWFDFFTKNQNQTRRLLESVKSNQLLFFLPQIKNRAKSYNWFDLISQIENTANSIKSRTLVCTVCMNAIIILKL